MATSATNTGDEKAAQLDRWTQEAHQQALAAIAAADWDAHEYWTGKQHAYENAYRLLVGAPRKVPGVDRRYLTSEVESPEDDPRGDDGPYSAVADAPLRDYGGAFDGFAVSSDADPGL